jgi:RNA polymerase sigma-70 factor (ECF subfamily)
MTKLDNSEFLPTRASLLSRLKDLGDEESWREFFECYGKLIYTTALRAGLNDAEAQDVVQETIMSITKSIPRFEYNPQRGSFKTWLMSLTRWRITDQFRKREPAARFTNPSGGSADRRTATIERVPDPNGLDAARVWDEEWDKNIFDLALERVKLRVDPKKYQMFDLSYFQNWPISRIAATLKVSSARIYLARHRVANLLRREIQGLTKKLSLPQVELPAKKADDPK